MQKISRLAGILCVGQNHNQAVENFRRTALGQNTMFYASKDGVAYASQSGVDLYNPNGGSELLDEHPDLVEKAEFQSESSAGDVKAFYTICLDGCGAHVISDSAANIQGCCPSCSADISEITDERVTQYLAESAADDEQVEHQGLVATGATPVEAQNNFAAALSNAFAFTAVSSVGTFSAANKVNFDPYTGASVNESKKQKAPESISALSSTVGDDQRIEAHLYSCSAKCDQPFTVSSDEEPVFCAHCSATLVDFRSESGEDSDIDILDEEDLDEDEDMVDDEDFDSESSDDDFDEEDEDDLDEDDFDEEDLDEDDLDEDEEDFDEEDFDSESSADEMDEEDFDEDDQEDDDLDDDEEAMDDDEFDSESACASKSGDDEEDYDEDEDLDLDEDDLDEDDLDLDEDEEDFDSESGVVTRTFNSLSAAQAQHGTLNPENVSLSRAVGKVDSVFMHYDGMPVARATFASVSNAVGEETAVKSFATDNFLRAVSVSLSQNGVADTCEAFGFMPFTIEMPVEKLLVAQSDARIEEVTESVSSTITAAIESHKDRLVAALSSAQLGVVKNYWGDVRNPIVDSLCSTLQAAGHKDPRPMVERAFIAHGKDFLTVALSKALDLMSKSEVAQNEISESIDAAAGTITKVETQNIVQTSVAAPKPAMTAAADILNQDVTVESQSSASTGSTFEDKLKRMRF